MSVKKKEETGGSEGFVKLLATILKEVGISNFVILMVVCIFIWYGNSEQKREFIDRFILLKNIDENPFPFASVIVFFIFIMIIGYTIMNNKIKILENENKRIGQQKSELEGVLLQKKLRSSGK
jgi:di/tricarboxylate transporter